MRTFSMALAKEISRTRAVVHFLYDGEEFAIGRGAWVAAVRTLDGRPFYQFTDRFSRGEATALARYWAVEIDRTTHLGKYRYK